jgi:hypothetical protein
MIQHGSGKALTNEKKFPNIVELPVPADGLKLESSRRIMEFHKLRGIQPRYGRRLAKDNQSYGRWCFADLGTACDFIEQFGGVLSETGL